MLQLAFHGTHQSILELLAVVNIIHSVGPTLIEIPVIVTTGDAKLLWNIKELKITVYVFKLMSTSNNEMA